jgi:hypothetical protein
MPLTATVASVVALAVLALLVTPDGALAQATSPAPLCAVSSDPDYARTPAKPAEVGGSPLFGGARQRRYLESLRGPAGQAVTFKRLPAVDAPDGETLIDRYEVTYEGLATPEILHLDWYRYTELKAPAGFACGQAFNLGLPPPDPFLTVEQLQRYAIANATVQAAMAPIPLGPDGGNPRAVALDHVRLVGRAALAAAASGTPMNANSIPADLAQPRSLILAFPQRCEDRVIRAASVTLEDPRGRRAEPIARYEQPAPIRRALPDVAVPDGSVAFMFSLDGPRAGFPVKIIYAEPCGSAGAVAELSAPVDVTEAKLVSSPMPVRNSGDAAIGSWVAVQALIDHTGQFREAQALGGAPELMRAAVEALSEWRAETPRVNGQPLASPVVVRVTFASR